MIDAYKIGVSIAMTSNASQVLGVLLKDLLGVEKGAKAAESSLGKVKLAAIGAGAALAGIAIAKKLWDVVDAGKALNDELATMVTRGGQFSQQLDAINRQAYSTTRGTPTSTTSQNVRTIGELGSQVGVGNAMALSPLAARFQALHPGGEADFRDLIKVIELRGRLWQKDAQGNEILGADGKPVIDMASVQSELDAANKAIGAQGGQLTVPMLLQLAKQASVVASQQSADTFYNKEGELAINMGASRAGTALASFAQQFQGGTTTQRTALEMQRLGYLKPGEWSTERGGHVVIGQAAKDRLAGDVRDPFAFAEGLVKRMQALNMSPEQMQSELTSLFGRQTVQRLFSDIINNAGSFHRASENAGSAQGINQAYDTLQKLSIGQNLNAFTASLTTFGEELSKLAAPTVIAILQTLTSGIQHLTDAMVAHPTIAKDLLAFTAAFAGFLAVTGTIVTIAAALSIFTPAFAGLTGALGVAAALAGPLTALGVAVVGLPRILHQIMDFVNDLLGIKNPRPGGDSPKYGNQGLPDQSSPGHGGGYDPYFPPDTTNNGHNLHYQGEPTHGGRAAPGRRLPPSGGGTPANDIQTPIPVHVTNGNDLVSGVGNGLAGQSSLPPSGPSSIGPRDFPGYPGMNPFGGP